MHSSPSRSLPRIPRQKKSHVAPPDPPQPALSAAAARRTRCPDMTPLPPQRRRRLRRQLPETPYAAPYRAITSSGSDLRRVWRTQGTCHSFFLPHPLPRSRRRCRESGCRRRVGLRCILLQILGQEHRRGGGALHTFE
ncbi:hypothetical protein BDA96_10G163500 [Sorghum bicolor]|uniref:Uncharacterized protein n=1 Tax=Sorghum bicolor TaxID=4558 RepID=A0A921Q3D7_SORBI|nr:hypothetical protein BDA96_10G163500 [Sorghum bicolor]